MQGSQEPLQQSSALGRIGGTGRGSWSSGCMNRDPGHQAFAEERDITRVTAFGNDCARVVVRHASTSSVHSTHSSTRRRANSRKGFGYGNRRRGVECGPMAGTATARGRSRGGFARGLQLWPLRGTARGGWPPPYRGPGARHYVSAVAESCRRRRTNGSGPVQIGRSVARIQPASTTPT